MISLLASLVVIVTLGLSFAPDMSEHGEILRVVALIAGVVAAVAGFAGRNQASSEAVNKSDSSKETAEREPEVRASVPEKQGDSAGPDYAEVLQLLGLLQQKGRFVDFLMEEVTSYPDAQVGAAARVVHNGCREVLKEHFEIKPVHGAPENSSVTLEPDYKREDYRLVGKVEGEPPYSGKLIHKGWKAEKITLPRATVKAGKNPPIAPAQVELK